MQETVLEFVAKKREIFLVQMSLDTRRAEIRKLQDRIFQREEVYFSFHWSIGEMSTLLFSSEWLKFKENQNDSKLFSFSWTC